MFCGLENELHYIIFISGNILITTWNYKISPSIFYSWKRCTRPLKLEMTLPEKTARVNYVYTEESEFLWNQKLVSLPSVERCNFTTNFSRIRMADFSKFLFSEPRKDWASWWNGLESSGFHSQSRLKNEIFRLNLTLLPAETLLKHNLRSTRRRILTCILLLVSSHSWYCVHFQNLLWGSWDIRNVELLENKGEK